jgi:intracellular septation protein A
VVWVRHTISFNAASTKKNRPQRKVSLRQPSSSRSNTVVFGGLTLLLQDELFIKLKPTIVNCLFGAVLLGGLAFASARSGRRASRR